MHLDYRLNEDREKDFSADWGWIPLVDLAASFAEIVRKLEDGSASETFEFTESDAWVRFERKGEKVLVSTSYGDGVGEIALHAASEAVKSFRERLRSELLRQHPQAAHNAAVRKLLGAV
jgi:hypothetical protein